MPDDDAVADPWADYESGPFCRHWYSVGECPFKCARCGHDCGMHAVPYDGATGQLCFEECECQGFVDPP